MQDVQRLADRVEGRTPTWYAARPTAAGSRVEVLRLLVAELAALGRLAGTGQPPDAEPPVLGVHALADQLRVLGAELAAAPLDLTAEVADAVRAAAAQL